MKTTFIIAIILSILVSMTIVMAVEQTPDPCPDYCRGDSHFYNGALTRTGDCNYQEEVCPGGCDGYDCLPTNADDGEVCPDTCRDGSLRTEGYWRESYCAYREEIICFNGCEDGYCLAPEGRTDTSCSDTCFGSALYSEGIAKDNGCLYEEHDECYFGCEDGACLTENPCPSTCENDVYSWGGSMYDGVCTYRYEDQCEFGCTAEQGCNLIHPDNPCPVNKCADEYTILARPTLNDEGECEYERSFDCPGGCYDGECTLLSIDDTECPPYKCEDYVYMSQPFINDEGECEYTKKTDCPGGCYNDDECILLEDTSCRNRCSGDNLIIAEEIRGTCIEERVPCEHGCEDRQCRPAKKDIPTELPSGFGNQQKPIDVDNDDLVLADELNLNKWQLKNDWIQGATKQIDFLIEETGEKFNYIKKGLLAFWPESSKAEHYGSETLIERELVSKLFINNKHPDMFSVFLPGTTCDLVVDYCDGEVYLDPDIVLDKSYTTSISIHNFNEYIRPMCSEENGLLLYLLKYQVLLSDELQNQGFPEFVEVAKYETMPEDFNPTGTIIKSDTGIIKTLEEVDVKKVSISYWACASISANRHLEKLLMPAMISNNGCSVETIEDLDAGWHVLNTKNQVKYLRYSYACQDKSGIFGN